MDKLRHGKVKGKVLNHQNEVLAQKLPSGAVVYPNEIFPDLVRLLISLKFVTFGHRRNFRLVTRFGIE